MACFAQPGGGRQRRGFSVGRSWSAICKPSSRGGHFGSDRSATGLPCTQGCAPTSHCGENPTAHARFEFCRPNSSSGARRSPQGHPAPAAHHSPTPMEGHQHHEKRQLQTSSRQCDVRAQDGSLAGLNGVAGVGGSGSVSGRLCQTRGGQDQFCIFPCRFAGFKEFL